VGEPTNGWRTGRDPVQRWLRAVTVIVCLVVFFYLATTRQTVDVVPTLALALGALLLLLGYESAIRVPGISRDAPLCPEPGCGRPFDHNGEHRRSPS
jgi:hypothetical protein